MVVQIPRRGFRSRVRSFANYVDAVRSIAIAVESGRAPSRLALEVMGLPSEAFDSLRKR